MEANLETAAALYTKKEFRNALVVLLAYTAQTDEENLEQAYYTGLCYARLFRFEDALMYLEQVVTSDTNIARIYQCRLILSFIYTKTNRTKMAEFELSKLRESGYESVHVFTSLGYLAYEHKDADKAIEFYEQALTLNPENSTAQNGLGYILADTEKDPRRALELCKKVVEDHPENGAYLDSLGWAYFKNGKMIEARVYTKRALEKLPDNSISKNHLKTILDTGEKK